MKGEVKPNGAMTSSYEFQFVDGPTFYVPRVGEVGQELVVAEMPDKTNQSTGQVNPGETEIDVPAHHDVAIAYMESLYAAAKSGAPGHKTAALMFHQDAGGNVKRTLDLQGIVVKGRSTPEHTTGPGEGELNVYTYTLAYDDVNLV